MARSGASRASYACSPKGPSRTQTSKTCENALGRAAVLIDSMSSNTACGFFRALCWRAHAEACGDSQYPRDALVRRFDHAVGVPVAARVVNATFEVKLRPHECERDKGT